MGRNFTVDIQRPTDLMTVIQCSRDAMNDVYVQLCNDPARPSRGRVRNRCGYRRDVCAIVLTGGGEGAEG